MIKILKESTASNKFVENINEIAETFREMSYMSKSINLLEISKEDLEETLNNFEDIRDISNSFAERVSYALNDKK